MQRARTFTYVFKKNLYHTDHYYKEVVRTPLLFSLKYFIALILITFSLSTIVKLNREDTGLGNFTRVVSQLDEIVKQFPDDLSVTVRRGKLRTNYERPVILWLDRKKNPYPAVVIDERSTPDKISQYRTLFLLNSEGIITRSDSKTNIYRFSNEENLILNKETIQKIANQLNRSPLILPVIIGIISSVAVVFMVTSALIGKLLYLFILSIITFVTMRLFVKKIPLTDIVKLAFHTSTAPILMESATVALGFSVGVSFWFPLLFLIFLVGAIYEVYLTNKA